MISSNLCGSCGSSEGGLNWNNYDPFLDEHVGIEGCHYEIPAVASTLLAMRRRRVDAGRGASSSRTPLAGTLRSSPCSSTYRYRPTPSSCA